MAFIRLGSIVSREASPSSKLRPAQAVDSSRWPRLRRGIIQSTMASAHHSRRQGSGDRAVRSLISLQSNASTARTLNLVAVYRRHGEDEAYRQQPFFRNALLNRCFVVKHRLRPNERDLFSDGRRNATKIILPIDISDLRAGARAFFIGQKGYIEVLEDLLGTLSPATQADVDLLEQLDALPSLDPFLMRERLKRAGITPARCYFDIADADMHKMFEFVKKEIAALIGLSFGDVDASVNAMTSKLATKILADSADEDMEPLRRGMGLDKAAFDEGVFCWKGFIYYKWVMSELAPQVRPVLAEMMAIRPVGPPNAEDRATIAACKSRLTKGISDACDTVRSTLKVYDDAYADLTKNGEPQDLSRFSDEGADAVLRTGRAPGGRAARGQLLAVPLPARFARQAQLGGTGRHPDRLRNQPRFRNRSPGGVESRWT